MPATASIETQVRSFIDDNFLFGRGTSDLGPDDSLVEHGVIDSTGVLELVSFLESEFALKLSDEELVPGNLDSVNRLVHFIESKQAVVKA